MTSDLTDHRFSPAARGVGAACAGLASIATMPAGFLGEPGALTFVAALVAFGGVWAVLERAPRKVHLRDLSGDDRQTALALAWMDAPTFHASPLVWGIALLAVAGVACAANVPEQLGTAVDAPHVLVATVLPLGLALVRHALVRPRWRTLTLRAAGVDFVRAHASQWIEMAAARASREALERFRQRDPQQQAYPLWAPQVASRVVLDLPARYWFFMVLAVGEFVGMRTGPFIDLKATAEAHAGADDPDAATPSLVGTGTAPEMLKETEFHFRDVVTVEYRRVAVAGITEPAGTFEIGLSDGQKTDFVTLESGPPVMAALENIRDRTRRAKAS